MPKYFVGGINQCFSIFKAWKIFLQKKEISLFSVGNFFSHGAENFREGNHSSFQKNSGMEEAYAEGEDITLSVETFFLTVPKNFVGGIIQGFRNIRAWKILCRRWGYHYFPLKTFYLTLPNKIVGNPFCVSKEMWYRKFSCIGVGGGARYGNPPVFRQTSGIVKF